MGIRRTPYYFKDFSCIGGKCEDNCCIGWEVDIDSDTLDVYKNTKGEFGQRLQNSMADNDENSFVLKNNRCPFLNDENLCDIFINLGEENLCTVCTEYPRFTEKIGDVTEVGLGMSCESAAELIFRNSEKTYFVTEETDDIDNTDIDKDFLNCLFEVRGKITDILQNRDMPLKDRIVRIFLYAEKVQKCVNDNRMSDIKNINDNFEIPEGGGTDDIKGCLELCLDLEIMEDSWIEVINDTLGIYDCEYEKNLVDFEKYSESKDYEYEHLLIYFIYRYLVKAMFDYDIFMKVKFAIVSYIIIKQLDISCWLKNNKEFLFENRVKDCVLYSKEVEHSPDNIEFFSDEFLFNEIFERERFLKMIVGGSV